MQTMKVLLPLTMIAALSSSLAFADCAPPADVKINMPNGSKATKDEMVATKKAINAYDAAIKTYGECLKTEQDAAIAAGGDKMTDEQRDKIEARYAEMTNAQVEKVQKIADKFNAELRAWKAKNPA
jgi:hypothetical protein